MNCPIPSDDDARVAALRSYSILDTTTEHAFDRLTRLARIALKLPIVLVSLVDRERQWFKSRQGITLTETPRSISFCGHAITETGPFIVPDATRDPRFRDNPVVVGEPYIRFYAGIPLRMRDGYAIGTLCAMDHRPRTLSAEETDVMQDLASMVVDAIELRQMAIADSLTGTLTRRGFEMEVSREFSRARRCGHALSVIALDIDHFKRVNDRYGHAAGDVVLKSLVAILRQEIRDTDLVARLGGEEFVILLPETGADGARILAGRIRQQIAGTLIEVQGHAIRVTASFGIAHCAIADSGWRTAVEKADIALYRAKREGRNRTVVFEEAAGHAAA